jgi:DNA transposition AAA+ family ATPase
MDGMAMELQGTEAVLAAVRSEIARGLTQNQVAREAGLSSASLAQLLGGNYPADPARLVSKLSKWLSLRREQAAQPQLPAAPGYVATPTAERIVAALAYAQMAGDIAVIYGGAGVGKSSAAHEYRSRMPNVWVATMSPATAGVAPALEEVCLALGIRELPGGAARMQREIVARLRGTGGLLVIDEAQHLSVAALDAIRALHDATGVGVALIGNEQIYARMTGGVRAAWLDRLFSRIGKRLRVARATREDVAALAAAHGVGNPEAIKPLAAIGAQAGALRGVTKCLRLARLMADGTGEALAAAHVAAAWKDLTGAAPVAAE